MRLLEFGREESGANPLRAGTYPSPGEPPGETTPAAMAHSARHIPSPMPFTPNEAIKVKQAGRRPVDLDRLKQRIDSLEHRMRAQSEKLDELTSSDKLDRLKQRMLRLEQCLQGELWTARQREHTLMEMLQKPALTRQLKQRLAHFWRQDLPAADRWLRRTTGTGWQDLPAVSQQLRRSAQTWQQDLPAAGQRLQRMTRNLWQDHQPGWWQRVVHAWQESIEQARSGAKHN